MLTPVVSKKQVKSKGKSGRNAAKELILRRDAFGNTASPVEPKETSQSADAGVAPTFTEDELKQLDLLFDMLSWLMYLFAGNYELANNVGQTIGLPAINPAKASEIKEKLRGKMNTLTSNIEKAIERPEPIEDSTVSDIQNEIKAAV